MKKDLLRNMRGILHSEAAKALDKIQAADPKAGIIIAPLVEILPIESDGQMYDFYAARVLPKTWVNPHYHSHGIEPYRFLSGQGEMNLGQVIAEGGRVLWDEQFHVRAEREVIVRDGIVHSFRNTGDVPADFLFACPKTHLCETDRFFTKEMKDGIPPHYPA